MSCKTIAGNELVLACNSLGGDEACILKASAEESVGAIQQRIFAELQAQRGIELLLPDGRSKQPTGNGSVSRNPRIQHLPWPMHSGLALTPSKATYSRRKIWRC